MKRRTLARRTLLGLGGVLAGAILAAGCASLPPAQTAQDIKSISGKWEGSLQVIGGYGLADLAGTLTISEEGRYELSIPSANPPRYTGTLAVVEGVYRFKSDTTGTSGTFTLHEGDGKRAIVQTGPGRTSGQFWAAK